jgi:SAM-dependent methyltransferase
MPSAWLSTPLDIYEKHVELDSVGQAAAIREILLGALRRHRPQSLLCLGCAGGNGLEHASGLRVVGLDLNPDYIEAARRRFPWAAFHVCDLNDVLPAFEPVEMAFGALVFEYLAKPGDVLRRLAGRIAAGGRLVVPLLQAAEGVPAVLPSPYLAALEPLGAEYTTLAPDEFTALAARAGFAVDSVSELPLPSGKRFVILDFLRR